MSQVSNPTPENFTSIAVEGGNVLQGTIDVENRLAPDASFGTVLRIEGGNLADILAPGANENIVLFGFAGDDSVTGSSGNDETYGNAGNDTLLALEGNDVMYGGQGNDLLYGGAGNDSMGGDKGNDILVGGSGDDTIRGNEGDDTLQGGEGNDVLFGEADNDFMQGGDGADTLYGGQGSDTLQGGAGSDFITGDKGNDVLVGGTQADVFAFTQIGTDNADTVQDFNSGDDQIGLSTTVFGDLGTSVTADEFTTFNSGNGDSVPGSNLAYDIGTGELYYNGELVATFTGTPGVNVSDFELF